ncbi:MAG: hypothetical protein AAGA83_00985 [Cyanobacteria bacterium P01_F01_bin.116]
MASSPDNKPAAMPPRPASGPDTEIDPQLENVLRNLNVNLEDELMRYRRQRHGRVPPPPPPRRTAQLKTIDLISVPATPGDSVPIESATPPPPPPNPFLKQQLSEPEEDPELAELEQMMVQDTSTEEVSGAETDEELLPVPVSDMPTEGYLESSEELLKSIAEEQTEPESVPEPYSPERKNNSLLKLAGLVLVLLGGIGVGFAITYPSQLQNLRSQLWPAGEPDDIELTETADTPAEPASPLPSADPSDASVDGYKPPGPDLSTQEFKDLDDVQDLVTLELDTPNSTPFPPVSNPAQTPIPTTPAVGQPAQSPALSSSAAPGTPAPATTPPAPAPAAAPTPATTPAAGSNFYVVSAYTGDASLNKARELVPDAFVRNFNAGARIQLAAFDNQAQAEDQVAALTQQGAVVELFGPTNE